MNIKRVKVDDARFAALWRAGASVEQMKSALGIGTRRVSMIREALGLPKRPKGPRALTLQGPVLDKPTAPPGWRDHREMPVEWPRTDPDWATWAPKKKKAPRETWKENEEGWGE